MLLVRFCTSRSTASSPSTSKNKHVSKIQNTAKRARSRCCCRRLRALGWALHLATFPCVNIIPACSALTFHLVHHCLDKSAPHTPWNLQSLVLACINFHAACTQASAEPPLLPSFQAEQASRTTGETEDSSREVQGVHNVNFRRGLCGP